MRISKYKNVTKKNIIILLDGKKITIKPNQFIEGSDTLNSYSGLLRVNKPIAELDSIVCDQTPYGFVTEIEEYDFNVPASKETTKINQQDIYIMNSPIESEEHMNKIDLSDITLIIPVSIESEDRKQNLTILLDYLNKHFDTNVIVCESSKEMKIKHFWKPEWSRFCRLLFLENKTSFFYKTRILNTMAKMAKTDIIVSYDSDVLLPPSKYVEAANKLRSKELDFCYPFNKPLKHIEKESLPLLRESLDLQVVDVQSKITHQGVPPGGCLFMNRAKFIEAGMENENMISWGPEDQERLSRVRKLNYNVGSIEGHLYHMDHMITQNSFYSNPLFKNNEKEFEKVNKMTIEELKEYIKGFAWVERK